MISNTLMAQGTTSNVGKSILVAGLCRSFARRGIRISLNKQINL